jgi:hypothetical protein
MVEIEYIRFFPGNEDNLPFSKMMDFSVTSDYDSDLFFFLNHGIQ